MDFDDFLDLRGGDTSPSRLASCMIIPQEQLWTLREYHLQQEVGRHDVVKPLPFGDPLLGFFPTGCRFTEKIESRTLVCREPGKTNDVKYTRWHPTSVTTNGIDILVVGGVSESVHFSSY